MVTPMNKTTSKKTRKQPPLFFKTGEDIKEFRRKHGLNQSQFWGRVGVTQSGGSRYESGRSIPRTVQILMHLSYGKDKAAADMLEWLREQNEA